MKTKRAVMSFCVIVAMDVLTLCAGENPGKSHPLAGVIRWDA